MFFSPTSFFVYVSQVKLMLLYGMFFQGIKPEMKVGPDGKRFEDYWGAAKKVRNVPAEEIVILFFGIVFLH